LSISIVHVISGLDLGGAERALFNLLDGFSDEERKVCQVISLTTLGKYGTKIQGLGVPVQALGLGRKPSTWPSLMTLRRKIRLEAPDILVSWMYHANIVAWLVSRRLPKAPVLLWNIRHCLHSLCDEKRTTRCVIHVHKWAYKAVDAVVYNSWLSLEQHTSFGVDSPNSVVIPNGFDPGTWMPDANDRISVRKSLGIPIDAKVVGHVGRYHPLKDQKTLLHAMRSIMRRYSDVHLLVVGKDVNPNNSSLRRYFDLLPSERVHILGERSDVHRLLRVVDVFCLSSKSEAFPNVLGEAMSTGVACISTDVGDARRIVGDTGFIVPVGDYSRLEKLIDLYIGLTFVEMSKAGQLARSRIIAHYSIDKNLKSYRDLFRDLIEKKKSK
jgi:glycosyltransferase involved in cell wall biosynthesis